MEVEFGEVTHNRRGKYVNQGYKGRVRPAVLSHFFFSVSLTAVDILWQLSEAEPRSTPAPQSELQVGGNQLLSVEQTAVIAIALVLFLSSVRSF